MKINTQRGIAPLLIVLLVVLLGGGVYVAQKNSSKNKNAEQNANNASSTAATSTDSQAATSTTATSTGKTLQITLSEQNKSGQSGKVVITEVDGKAKVIVNITGKPSSVAQPAHIHLNSCSNIGGVKYPLTNVGNGASQTMLDISIDQLLAQLPLSINVHKSEAELSAYVACGDISSSTAKIATSTKEN